MADVNKFGPIGGCPGCACSWLDVRPEVPHSDQGGIRAAEIAPAVRISPREARE